MSGGAQRGRLIIAAMVLGSAAPALALPADFKAKADAFVESAWPADGPGASVIVVEHGRTVYVRGRGLADVAAGTPITPDTVFRLGSISKQFSAAVVMQLVQEGKLSLDDPLSKFLPDYPQPGASATVRQLLNHTSGVQPYTAIPGWMVEANTNRPYTTEQMIAVFRDLPAVTPPGQAWAYNNSGYVLVGAIIEAVTGKPWYQAVEERIAKPLRLRTIRYGVGEESIPNMARGYTEGEQGQQPARRIHMSVPHAAGGLVGNVRDLARWGQALHHGKVVGPEAYAKMIAPTGMPDGKTMPYGFGLGREAIRGHGTIGHSGGIFGFSTESVYVPDEDLFIAVFANSDDPATKPSIAALRLTAMALGQPFPDLKPMEVAPASIEPLSGVYRVGADGGERSFYARGGELFTRRGDSPEMKVYSAGGDLFFYGPNSLTWFAIRRDSAGAHVMEMHQNGEDSAESAVRSGPVPPEAPPFPVPRATLERYVGTYAFGQATATIAWGAAPDSLTVQLTGQQVRPLRAKSATEFLVEGVGAGIVFHGETGPAERLVIHQGGREIQATRVAQPAD
jgi:D-alanyl-D-alanine carboxypeptidase